MKLKIDEVADAVFRQYDRQRGIGELAVYMTPEFYAKCRAGIAGRVSSSAIEFANDGTVMGVKVYRVLVCGYKDTHPDYRVVEV